MIYVTQGHEEGIGLEVFFKALLSFGQTPVGPFHLIAYPGSISKTLSSFSQPFQITDDKILFNDLTLNYSAPKTHNYSESLETLLWALPRLKSSDLLVTLPTSKDQLFHKGQHHHGYTEFFRSYYKNENLVMMFHAREEQMILLTDHIPLKDVPRLITRNLVREKLSLALKNTILSPISKVLIAGINPHAGEGGLLGTEEFEIEQALSELRKEFPTTHFIGPLPPDTLHFHQKGEMNQLLVYAFHDQGLPKFKALHGLKAANITLGLPFLRLSVDHGTSFHLYGKNCADPSGASYILSLAEQFHKANNESRN